MKKFITVLAVILTLAGTALGKKNAKASAADAAKRQAALQNTSIVPGESIGVIRLGMGMDEVENVLGQPTGWKYYPQGSKAVSEASSWMYSDLNLEIFFDRGVAPIVTSVHTTTWVHRRITSGNYDWKDMDRVKANFKTAYGILLGSSAFDVKRAYSNYGFEDQQGQFMNYRSLGLTFAITGDHMVWRIGVSKPQ